MTERHASLQPSGQAKCPGCLYSSDKDDIWLFSSLWPDEIRADLYLKGLTRLWQMAAPQSVLSDWPSQPRASWFSKTLSEAPLSVFLSVLGEKWACAQIGSSMKNEIWVRRFGRVSWVRVKGPDMVTFKVWILKIKTTWSHVPNCRLEASFSDFDSSPFHPLSEQLHPVPGLCVFSFRGRMSRCL